MCVGYSAHFDALELLIRIARMNETIATNVVDLYYFDIHDTCTAL